ncbi:MAG: trimeric intracellular cation channel family protein [Solirubrobacteraceae bacterium]
MVPGFDPTLILVLNLAGTFVFGLSGGLAAVRARLDLFGVVVLAAVVGLAGGITRDVLTGVPPATFRDWRYLAVVGGAGVVSFLARPALDRLQHEVQILDAAGLGVFCVTGATTALDHHLGLAEAVILGAITGIGGGMLRDVLLRQVPTVLRSELYAVPALIGAGILVGGHATGSRSAVFPILGALVCFAIRVAGMRYGIEFPVAPSERSAERPAEGPPERPAERPPE